MTPQEFLKGKEYILDVGSVEPTPIVPKIGVFDPRTNERLQLRLVPSLTVRLPFGTATSYVEQGKPIVKRIYFDDGRVLQSIWISPYGIPGKTRDDVERINREGWEWIRALETME